MNVNLSSVFNSFYYFFNILDSSVICLHENQGRRITPMCINEPRNIFNTNQYCLGHRNLGPD